jgi:hypothetical protein
VILRLHIVLMLLPCLPLACGTGGAVRRPVTHPHPPVALAFDPADTLGARLSRVVEAANHVGGLLAHEASRMLLVEGERRAVEIALTGGHCHLLVGLAAPSVGDLDLALHELGGMQLAQDAERDAFPSIRFCPPRRTDVFAVVSSYQGAGEVLVADLELPAEARLDVSRALGETAPPEPPIPPLPPGVLPGSGDPDEPGRQITSSAEQALTHNAQELLDIGYVSYGESGGGTLLEGTVAAHAVNLSAGSCYALLASGGPGVRDLDLRLLDPAGGELARDTATDPSPLLRVCPEVSGAFRLEVRMFSGSGPYAYRTLLLSSLGGVSSTLPSSVRQRFAELSGRLRKRGFVLRGPLIRGGLYFGNRQLHSLDLESDRCYALAAAGGGEGDLDLYIWGPDGASMGSDTADDSSPTVMFCTTEPRTVDAEVRLFRARSEYVLGVFVSPGDGG